MDADAGCEARGNVEAGPQGVGDQFIAQHADQPGEHAAVRLRASDGKSRRSHAATAGNGRRRQPLDEFAGHPVARGELPGIARAHGIAGMDRQVGARQGHHARDGRTDPGQGRDHRPPDAPFRFRLDAASQRAMQPALERAVIFVAGAGQLSQFGRGNAAADLTDEDEFARRAEAFHGFGHEKLEQVHAHGPGRGSCQADRGLPGFVDVGGIGAGDIQGHGAADFEADEIRQESHQPARGHAFPGAEIRPDAIVVIQRVGAGAARVDGDVAFDVGSEGNEAAEVVGGLQFQITEGLGFGEGAHGIEDAVHVGRQFHAVEVEAALRAGVGDLEHLIGTQPGLGDDVGLEESRRQLGEINDAAAAKGAAGLEDRHAVADDEFFRPRRAGCRSFLQVRQPRLHLLWKERIDLARVRMRLTGIGFTWRNERRKDMERRADDGAGRGRGIARPGALADDPEGGDRIRQQRFRGRQRSRRAVRQVVELEVSVGRRRGRRGFRGPGHLHVRVVAKGAAGTGDAAFAHADEEHALAIEEWLRAGKPGLRQPLDDLRAEVEIHVLADQLAVGGGRDAEARRQVARCIQFHKDHLLREQRRSGDEVAHGIRGLRLQQASEAVAQLHARAGQRQREGRARGIQRAGHNGAVHFRAAFQPQGDGDERARRAGRVVNVVSRGHRMRTKGQAPLHQRGRAGSGGQHFQRSEPAFPTRLERRAAGGEMERIHGTVVGIVAEVHAHILHRQRGVVFIDGGELQIVVRRRRLAERSCAGGELGHEVELDDLHRGIAAGERDIRFIPVARLLAPHGPGAVHHFERTGQTDGNEDVRQARVKRIVGTGAGEAQHAHAHRVPAVELHLQRMRISVVRANGIRQHGQALPAILQRHQSAERSHQRRAGTNGAVAWNGERPARTERERVVRGRDRRLVAHGDAVRARRDGDEEVRTG